jgi:hypothetical protein
MTYSRKRASGRAAEPVQVYLKPDEQDRLTRLTERLTTSKSEVLRRGLEALEREVTNPAGHPALAVIGIGMGPPGEPDEDARALDPARDHDAVLAGSEERSWVRRRPRNAGDDEGADGA